MVKNRFFKENSTKFNSRNTVKFEEEIAKKVRFFHLGIFVIFSIKNEEISRLKKGFLMIEQENLSLKEQNKRLLKEKMAFDDEIRKKQGKFKSDLIELEQKNFNMMKEVKNLV